MLTLQYIRDHADEVRAGLARKRADAPLDEILALDAEWRAAQQELQDQQTRRNELQKNIQQATDAAARQAAIDATRDLSARIKELEPRVDAFKVRLDALRGAAQQVVAHSRDEARGIGLGLELVEHIIGVGARPEIRIARSGLPPAHIVGVGGDVARRIGDRHGLPLAVLDGGAGLRQLSGHWD